MISRRAFVRALTGGLVAAPLAAEAQPKRTTPRNAVLDVGSSSASSARTEWFRKSMRELEYVEGQNIEITWRYAGGMYARLSNLASELIGLTPDVLVSPDEWGVRALLKANPDIPIVMAGADAWSNFITPENLAKPTRNITGVISARSNLEGKRMELLRETLPAVSRVASFRASTVFNYPEGRFVDVAVRAVGPDIHRDRRERPRRLRRCLRGGRREAGGRALAPAHTDVLYTSTTTRGACRPKSARVDRCRARTPACGQQKRSLPPSDIRASNMCVGRFDCIDLSLLHHRVGVGDPPIDPAEPSFELAGFKL